MILENKAFFLKHILVLRTINFLTKKCFLTLFVAMALQKLN